MPERDGGPARGTEKRAQKRVSSIQPDTAEGARSTGTGAPRPHLERVFQVRSRVGRRGGAVGSCLTQSRAAGAEGGGPP